MARIVSDRQIIADLGGVTAFVAIGYGHSQVKKWIQRGIPWKERARVKDFADERRKRLPSNFLQSRQSAA